MLVYVDRTLAATTVEPVVTAYFQPNVEGIEIRSEYLRLNMGRLGRRETETSILVTSWVAKRPVTVWRAVTGLGVGWCGEVSGMRCRYGL